MFNKVFGRFLGFTFCLVVLLLLLSWNSERAYGNNINDFIRQNDMNKNVKGKLVKKKKELSDKPDLNKSNLSAAEFVSHLKESLNQYKSLVNSIMDRPSLDLVLEGTLNDPVIWLDKVLEIFSNKTIVFYDSNSLGEAKMVNKTLTKYGARFSNNSSLSDLVFINLDKKSVANSPLESLDEKENTNVTWHNNLLKEVQILLDYNFEIKKKEMPYIFMNSIFIGNNATVLEKAYTNVSKMFNITVESVGENKLNLSEEQKKIIFLRNDPNTIYDIISSYMTGPTIRDYFSEIDIMNPKKLIDNFMNIFDNEKNDESKDTKTNNTMYIIGRSSSFLTRKTLKKVKSLNPPEGSLIFIDLDDENFYKNVYTDFVPLNVKMNLVESDMEKCFMKGELPYIVVNGKYVGGYDSLLNFISMIKNGIKPKDEMTSMINNLLKSDKTENEVKKRLKYLKMLRANKKNSVKKIVSKLKSATVEEAKNLKLQKVELQKEISSLSADLKKQKNLMKSVTFIRLMNLFTSFQKEVIKAFLSNNFVPKEKL